MDPAGLANKQPRISDTAPCENILVAIRTRVVVLIKSREKVNAVQGDADWDGQRIRQSIPFEQLVRLVQGQKKVLGIRRQALGQGLAADEALGWHRRADSGTRNFHDSQQLLVMTTERKPTPGVDP